jgi:hypothetical protein
LETDLKREIKIGAIHAVIGLPNMLILIGIMVDGWRECGGIVKIVAEAFCCNAHLIYKG